MASITVGVITDMHYSDDGYKSDLNTRKFQQRQAKQKLVTYTIPKETKTQLKKKLVRAAHEIERLGEAYRDLEGVVTSYINELHNLKMDNKQIEKKLQTADDTILGSSSTLAKLKLENKRLEEENKYLNRYARNDILDLEH